MTKDEIEDILTGMEVQTEPGGAGWIATKDIDKTADVFVEAIDKSYNQAIDAAIKLLKERLSDVSSDEYNISNHKFAAKHELGESIKQFENLKKKV